MGAPGDPGPEFERLSVEGRLLYLRHDLVGRAGALLARLENLGGGGSGAGAGNRASGFRLGVEGAPELFVRVARRGGMVRFLLDDLYFGFHPRPLRELALAVEARRRGAPAAEPMGAVVERLAPGIYRAMMLTRAMRGTTLWEFMRAGGAPQSRERVTRLARRSIDAMHQAGLFHADLNLSNLFVETGAEEFVVTILDLDKARLLDRPLPPAMRRRNLRRLGRSIRKLDPAGRYLSAAAREILTAPA